MKKNNIAKALSLAFLGNSLLLAGNSSYAQQAPDADSSVEKIEVTGSRIKRTDMESTVPISIISSAEIAASGNINLADVLKQQPVTISTNNTSSTTFTTSSVGINNTALRNLGTARTLILVNGRRFVSGLSPSVGYGVDLNSIPAAMIERIEILKSASSAVYGSDAVAGVINIILKDDMEGVEVSTQFGMAEEGDSERNQINLTAGGNWDKGNAWVSVGFDKTRGIRAQDRSFSEFDIAVVLDENDNEVYDTVFSSFPPQGRVGSYNGDGTPFNFAQDANGTDRFNRASFRQLVTPLERKYAAAGANVEVNDEVTVYSEIQWNSTETNDSTIEPFPFDLNDIWIPERGGEGGLDVNSPLVPDLLRENLLADGVTNLNQVSWVRRMVEFGPRSTDLTRDTVRIATGVEWAVSDDWVLDTYLTWGKTQQTQENGGQINLERARFAFDVEVGPDNQLRCTDQIARLQGCVPFNVFGEGTISQDAVDYLRTPAKTLGQVEQFVVSSVISGELPVELGGGPIGVAAGIEYRDESGLFSPGDLAQTGASSTNQASPTDGEFDTFDYFAEFSLPVTEAMRIDLAARYSDHSIVGGQATWNLGFEYRPIDELMLRASAARAVRTPNISDLFGGRGETFAGVTDPCNGVTAADTSTIAQNCLSIPGIAQRVADNGSFTLSQIEAQGVGGTIGGSPDVKEETSDSWSLGIVYQFMENASLTLDYYDFEVNDAIATTTRTVVLQRCFDQTANEFEATCNGSVVRGANGVLATVDSGSSNENILKTSGLDLEMSYQTEIDGLGDFNAALVWNHITKFEQIGILDGRVLDYKGELANPENRINLNLGLTSGDMTYSWRIRYWDEAVDSNEGENFNFSNFQPLGELNTIDAQVYHDVSLSYNATDTLLIRAGINNLLDETPPLIGQGTKYGGTGINTFSAAYDVVGRYYYAGLTWNF
ncbi:MAG: TonB-dependent receptor [Aliiglaciecola sp.]